MSHTESLSASELEQAFEVFSRVSHELDTTYRELETKVAALTAELAAARSARLVELAEKERLAHRLSSLVAAIPGGVLLVDGQAVIRDANPQATELLGSPLLGRSWSEVLLRASGKDALESQELLLNNGMRYSVCSRQLDRSGDQVVLITDVSQIHNLQEQLGRKKRLTALGEMAARLAHQIRTPLSSTTLYMAQLGRDDLSSTARSKVVSKVNKRLEHMSSLLESMLSFVRGAVPSSQSVCMAQVLNEFSSTVTPQLVQSNSTLRVPTLDHTLTVEGDKDALVGALTNLAMNALEASDGAVALEVWVGALNENWMQLRFSDTGPGIEDEMLERVFDPFFTTRAAGTGLGLAVVANTVTHHGGAISVRNREGGGAEFIIDLPISNCVNTQSTLHHEGDVEAQMECSKLRKTANE